MKPSQDVWHINLATETVQWLHFVIALLFLLVHTQEETAIVDEPREMAQASGRQVTKVQKTS